MHKSAAKKLFVGTAAVVVLFCLISIVGMIDVFDRGVAQISGARSTVATSLEAVYGPEDNSLGYAGMTFKEHKTITVHACGAGGGGGGGGQGYEDGDDEGNGGGGGGGGGKGTCLTKSFKLRAGDTLRWQAGTGGMGGLGATMAVYDNYSVLNTFTNSTSGGNGGNSYVSINGIDIMMAPGGNGGAYGSSAIDNGMGGGGGWGGSPVYYDASWHAGRAGGGQWDNPLIHQGNGGAGGRGETNTVGGDMSSSGAGGITAGNWPYGGNGGDGPPTFGGSGGNGGRGGDGRIMILW